MHRLKLVGLLLLLVVGLAFSTYFVVKNEIGARFRKAVYEDLIKTQMHFRALKLAQDKVLLQVAEWLSNHRDLNFAKALKEADEDVRHREAFAAIAAVRPLLQKSQRTEYDPQVVLVTDKSGKLLARDRFVNEWGRKLDFPLLARVAQDGVRDKDVWKFREQNYRMMTVVAAPIRDGSETLGVLSLLYEHNNQMALDDRKTFTMEEHFHPEVAYYLDGTVYGSSLPDPVHIQQITAFVKENDAALREGKTIGPVPLEVGGKRTYAMAAAIDDNATSRTSGYVLLGSLDVATAPVTGFLSRLPFVAAAFFLVSVILGLLILRSVTATYDRIEQGVLEMVAGNTEYKFDPNLPGGAGSLAHALNLLVAQLLGRPPPDREPADMAWADPLFITELSPDEIAAHGYHAMAAHQGDLDSGLGLTVAYYEKLFGDYLEARRRSGERAEGITLEQFVEKVRKNEAALRNKYNCVVVKFEVETRDGKVALRPIPIK